MATPSFPEAALTAGSAIGRYFSIVTVVPTLFLVLWTYVLLSSDAWAGSPNVRALGTQLGELSVAKVAWLLVITMVLAFFLHPLQFATVQVLEGYWGVSHVGLGAARVRVRHHRLRMRQLDERVELQRDRIDEEHERWSGFSDNGDADAWSRNQDTFLGTPDADKVLRNLVEREALTARLGRYPSPHRILPTRLGNALRGYEDRAGAQYGLAAVPTAPHFSLVIPESHLAYVRDSRQLLDTTIRLCFVSLVAALLTVSATLTDGWWLLVALLPYGLAYLAYRAAVSAADEYGTAVATIIDLDRFLLYDALGVARPADTAEERTTNRDLMALVQGNEKATVTYVHGEPQQSGTGVLTRLVRRLGRRGTRRS